MIDEGTIKFGSHWTESPPLDLPEIAELLTWRFLIIFPGNGSDSLHPFRARSSAKAV